MANNSMKEYWVMHRPRHPLWGTIMFGATGTSPVASPIANAISVYTGDERDYLFYSYTANGVATRTYAVTEKPWLQHTVCYSMENAVTAAKRLISYVGQDNVRIAHIINGTVSVQY